MFELVLYYTHKIKKKDGTKKMFTITEGKGIHITFENKLTVSIQFGKYNYCDNRSEIQKNENGVYSKNCEVAILDKKGDFVTKKFIDCINDDVKGYVEADEIAKIIFKVSEYKK